MNTITLMIKWYREPDTVTMTTGVLNYIFTAVFIIECAIRVLGIGFHNYFNDRWNAFDFGVILSSIVAIIISLASPV